MKCPILITFIGCLLLSSLGAHSTRADMTGALYEHIDSTNPFEAFFLALSPIDDEESIGFAASPRADGNEIGDALKEFTNMGGAMARLEALKRENNFSGGRVFAAFNHNDKGHFEMACGISNSESQDWDEVRAGGKRFGSSMAGGSFPNFKRANRAERVRAIAGCLASLPGMPALAPAKHKITGVFVDANSYTLGALWLKRGGWLGTKAQYDLTMRCLVTELGRSMPDAVSETAIMKTEFSSEVAVVNKIPSTFGIGTMDQRETKELNMVISALAVTNLAAAQAVYKNKKAMSVSGVWATKAGFGDSALNDLFKPVGDKFSWCARDLAKLVNVNFANGLTSLKGDCKL